MNRIVIEVDENVARAFMQADRQRQKNISSVINGWLKKIMNASSMSVYKQMMDAMSEEAARNGLTAKSLDRLLKEDD